MTSKNDNETNENTIDNSQKEANSMASVLREALDNSSDKKEKSEAAPSEATELQKSYDEALEEITQLKDQILRSAAESENLRKRSSKQIDDAGKFAVNGFAKDLIEVLENLYLATDNLPKEEIEKDSVLSSISQGIEMTKTTLINAFEKHGVKRIMPQVKDSFDPNLHQAVAHIEQADFDDNSIVNVMRAGYVLHDRLLKPSMVVVAKSTQNQS